MEKLETIMTIIVSIFGAIVIGAWILSLGEFAVPIVVSTALIIGVAMLQPEKDTIVIEIEYED